MSSTISTGGWSASSSCLPIKRSVSTTANGSPRRAAGRAPSKTPAGALRARYAVRLSGSAGLDDERGMSGSVLDRDEQRPLGRLDADADTPRRGRSGASA
jgi:hypothetical protein